MKDAVALFGMEYDHNHPVNRHTYHWDTLKDMVLREKFQLICQIVDSEEDKGMAFLYRVMNLLRGDHRSSPILLARLAYLLARHLEKNKDQVQPIYQWAVNPVDREALLTAIMLYIYTHRKPKKEEKQV